MAFGLFRTYTDGCTYHYDALELVADSVETVLDAFKRKFGKRYPLMNACINIDDVNEVLRETNERPDYCIRELKVYTKDSLEEAAKDIEWFPDRMKSW